MFLPQFFWYTHPLDSFDFFTLSKVMSKDILDGLFPKRNVPLLRISIFIFEVHPPWISSRFYHDFSNFPTVHYLTLWKSQRFFLEFSNFTSFTPFNFPLISSTGGLWIFLWKSPIRVIAFLFWKIPLGTSMTSRADLDLKIDV